MPLTTQMVWQADKARWRKLYKGQLYYVTCATLGMPKSKAESASAANAWWRAKLVEIGANHPQASHLEELDRRRSWSESHGEAIEASNLAVEIERVRKGGEPVEDTPILSEIFREAGLGEVPPVEQLRDLLATEARWAGRLGAAAAPEDRTVGALIDRYVARDYARVEAGDLSPSEYDSIRRCLGMYRDWLGGSNGLDVLTADRWDAWWAYLLGSDRAVDYKKRLFRHAKSFQTWLGEMGIASPPLNLHSRRYKFGGAPKSIPILENGGVKTLIVEAPGQLKLHLLLMANCGMTQIDISDLQPSEIDWERGRIRRKRSKTSDRESVPTVEYPLWAPTLDLLVRYGLREGDHALMTRTGRTWIRDEIRANGKRHRVDVIKSNYVHLAGRLGVDTPMKLIRKTSASLLEGHEVYGRYVSLYLGHSPRSIADRHYVRPSQGLFDDAIKWLGGQYELSEWRA